MLVLQCVTYMNRGTVDGALCHAAVTSGGKQQWQYNVIMPSSLFLYSVPLSLVQKLDYQWYHTGTIEADSDVITLSWNQEGELAYW